MARLETRVKRAGQWTREVIFLVSSLTLEQLAAAGMLRLKRNYWIIESRLHHCLDMAMQEDLNGKHVEWMEHVTDEQYGAPLAG